MRAIGRDPNERAKRLRRRFQAISSRWDRQRSLQRVVRRIGKALPFVIVTAGLVIGGLMNSPWPPGATLRHLAAFPNCAAARAVGLAPARIGEPGYYSRHDADDDGIACEPWPPARR